MGERKCEGNERQVRSYWLWSSPGIFSTILLFAVAIVFQVLISLPNNYLYLLLVTQNIAPQKCNHSQMC